jgi:transcriptional regulator with XRE-family HTH domain
MKQKLMPREALARNVKHLMSIHNQSEEDLAKISGVSQKTINNVVNQRTATSLDNIEKLAAAWGLTGWQLIIPSLPDELIGSGRIAKIYQNYVGSSPDGRKHIEMVAEREAAYTVNKQDK